jgi:hypothetical protein
MGSCAAPSAKGDDKFITTDYLQQCLPYSLSGSSWEGRLPQKIHPTKANRISGDMRSNNHRDGSLWRFSLYGTQAGRVGHFPKLISPQFVRPFVKSNKNDFVDAEAICEAASRPSMRFVQPRTESQQAMRALHRVRESLVQDKVKQLIRCMLFCWNLVSAFREVLPLLVD